MSRNSNRQCPACACGWRPARRGKAILGAEKKGNNNVGEAFNDNVVLDYAGLPVKMTPPPPRDQLLDLVWE
jgi:hypothetical protein